MRFGRFCENWQLEYKIKQLSPTERLEILEKLPLEALPFQGEGYHIFLKSKPYYSGFVTSIGEISPEETEDLII